jgi:hypothetical protein
MFRDSVEPIALCMRLPSLRSDDQTRFYWHDLLLKVGTDAATARSVSGSVVDMPDVEPQCVLYLPGSKLHAVAWPRFRAPAARRDGCRPLGAAHSPRASTASPFQDSPPCKLSSSHKALSFSADSTSSSWRTRVLYFCVGKLPPVLGYARSRPVY